MKKFITSMLSALMIFTAFTSFSSAAETQSLTVEHPTTIGALENQKGGVIVIKENAKDSWKDSMEFELTLPAGMVWNENTNIDKQWTKKETLTKNGQRLNIKVEGLSNQEQEYFYVVPYFDVDKNAPKGEVTVVVYTNGGVEKQSVKIADLVNYSVSLKSKTIEKAANTNRIPLELEIDELVQSTLQDSTTATIFVKNAKIVPDTVRIRTIIGNKDLKIRTEREDYIDVNVDGSSEKQGRWVVTMDVIPNPGFEGDIFAGFEARGIDSQQVVVASVGNPIKIEKREIGKVTLGQKDQKLAPVIFQEAFSGALTKGNYTIRIAPDYKGFEFEKAYLDYNSDIRVRDIKVDGGKIHFSVKTESTKPAKITLDDIRVNLDNNAMTGNFTLELVKDDKPSEVIAQTTFFTAELGNTPVTPAPVATPKTTLVFTIRNNAYTEEINGIKSVKTLDAPPFIAPGNRTMLPLRAVAESLGLDVEWNGATRQVTLINKNQLPNKIVLTIDSNKMIVDGVEMTLDSQPQIVEDRTFLPVAQIGEVLGLKHGQDILWNQEEKTVTIIK